MFSAYVRALIIESERVGRCRSASRVDAEAAWEARKQLEGHDVKELRKLAKLSQPNYLVGEKFFWDNL